MTRTWIAAALSVAAVFAHGCSEPDDVCLTEPVYGLSLRVRDSLTQARAAAGAYATARDGITLVVLYRPPFDSLQFTGVQIPGSYDVTVSKPGYRTWYRSDVQIVAGPCFVGGVTIEVLLQPIDIGPGSEPRL